MVKFGVSIWIGEVKAEDKIRRLHNVGLNYVEISIDYPLPFKRLEFLEELYRTSKELGVDIAFHLPWRDVALASPISWVRKASLKTITNAIEYTLKMEPIYYNLHLLTMESLRLKDVWEEILEVSIDSLNEILDMLKPYNIMLLLENNNTRIFHTPDHISYIAQVIDEIMFCFDIGHAVIALWREGIENVEVDDVITSWSKAYPKGRLITIHVHGVRRDPIRCIALEHIPLKYSFKDFRSIKRLIKEHNIKYANVEIFNEPKHMNNLKIEEIEDNLKLFINGVTSCPY